MADAFGSSSVNRYAAEVHAISQAAGETFGADQGDVCCTHPGKRIAQLRPHTQKVWSHLLTHAIEPARFVMTRRMLLGLKQRAEELRTASIPETRANQRPAA